MERSPRLQSNPPDRSVASYRRTVARALRALELSGRLPGCDERTVRRVAALLDLVHLAAGEARRPSGTARGSRTLHTAGAAGRLLRALGHDRAADRATLGRVEALATLIRLAVAAPSAPSAS